MKKRKGTSISRQGFTLIELLLVMAVVGILAGTILVGVSGQREKARASSALESANSILPYAVECYLREGSITSPNDVGGNSVCSGAPLYPSLTSGCEYNGSTATYFRIDCDPSYQIRCYYSGDGNCEFL